MDILSYAIASKQSRRIKRFIADPDSNSGIITTPSKIAAGEIITIPVGRTAILPDMVIEGELIIEGDAFIPSGGSYNQVDMVCDNIKSRDKTVTIETKQLVDTVREQDISGKKNFLNGLTTQGENITPYSGFKNLLVNGNFDIWNSGTSFTGSDIITADRWRYHCASGGTVTKGNTSGNLGKSFPLVMTKTVNTPYQFISQVLPSFAFLSGKTVTISCKVYCTGGLTKVSFGMTGNPGINSSIVTTTPSWTVKDTFNIGSETLKTISKTITLPTFANDEYTFAVGIYIGDVFTTELGSVSIREVQMEIGDKATPFEHRPYDLETILCGEPYKHLATGYKPFSMISRKGIKNLLINGNFDIWQRGTNLTGVVDTKMLADRWTLYGGETQTYNAGKYDIAGRPFLSVNSTQAWGHCSVSQRIENQNRMVNKTFTMTASFSATVGETIYLYVERPSVGFTFRSKPIVATGGTQEITFTFNVPADYTTNDLDAYGIYIYPSATVSKTLNVFAIQLEESPYFTGYEVRPIGLELVLCQRYYEVGDGYGLSYANSGAASQRAIVWFKVNKRVVPTVTVTYYSGLATTPSVGYVNNHLVIVPFASTGAGQDLLFTWTSNAEI